MRFPELSQRFARAAASLGAAGNVDATYARLEAAYLEPHRAYHGLEHVRACLAWLDRLGPDVARPHEVEMALWFHDAIYDLGPNAENEARSAAWACEALSALGAAPEAIQRIEDLVRVTERHHLTGDEAAADPDKAALIDIDLSILGSSPEVFARYEQDIAKEYAWVDPETYRAGRRAVLERFLAKDRLYWTPKMASWLESQARANLTRALGDLTAP